MSGSSLQWTVLENAEAVAQRACTIISTCARDSIAARGGFSLVLAGGSTPKRSYELLRATTQDWARWQIFFGDERCLPAEDRERNSVMATEALLAHVPIPSVNVHPIPADQEAQRAADAYACTIAGALPFDMVLLGMGEDGHTASLFPGQTHAADERVHAVSNAPKPPPARVTLGADTLGDCRDLLFIVTGAAKRDAVRAWQGGDRALPVAQIHPRRRAQVLLDRDAASLNEI